MAPRRGKPDASRERVVREAERLGMAPSEAAQLGLQCRRLMDSARLLHLRRHGFDVSLVEHVDFRVTADNVMLSAVRSAAPPPAHRAPECVECMPPPALAPAARPGEFGRPSER